MTNVKLRKALVAFVAVLTSWPALAQENVPVEGVPQAAYGGLQINDYPTTPAQLPIPAVPAPTMAPSANGPMMVSPYPPAGQPDVIYSPSEAWDCPPDEMCSTSTWTAGLELIATQSHLTESQFGRWPDDGALAGRLVLGYEDPTGYGTRVRFWGFGQDVETPADDIELSAGTFQWDFYKRLFIDDTEIALGAGLAGAGLEFQLSDDSDSRFSGGGITLFAEGFHPFYRGERTDIGFVGRGRLSLLEGEWRDNTGILVPDTDHDSMSVVEAAWGLELRRRFGRHQDHHWFVSLLAEHQRWESAWMGEFMDSSMSFTGTNLNFGVAW